MDDDKYCGYLTDVEGNYDYFKQYVELSKVLKWNENKTELVLKAGCEFVFGGDAVDKGIGDIRFVKHMLKLKETYGDRVNIILGNRDCNKLRLATELRPDVMEKTIDDKSFPYWLPEAERVTPAMHYKSEGGIENNKINRLKWMLKHTMGSDGAFERRKKELAEIQDKEESKVTDDEVVDSYLNSVLPDGKDNFMYRYMQAGKLGHRYGSVLFVHGGLNEDNIGAAPVTSDVASDVNTWVANLNKFVVAQLEEYAADPTSKKKEFSYKDGPGFGLKDYAVPGGCNGKGVVNASFLDNGNAVKPSKKVEDFLAASGITCVVTGHVPHGDCPCVINGDRVRIVTADTSYSSFGHTSIWGVDNRGKAVGELLISEDGSVHAHGMLADGSKYEYKLGVIGKTTGDEFVGRQLPDKSWVKAKLHDKDEYVVCLGEGRKLTHRRMTSAELRDVKWADNKVVGK